MSGPVLAILLTIVVHFVGAIVLIWAMAGKDTWKMFRPGADGGDGGQRRPPAPTPVAPRPTHGIPLPDAEASPVRMREPGRLAGGYPTPARRPEHVPAPRPEREPA